MILLIDDEKDYLKILGRLLAKNKINDYQLFFDYKLFLEAIRKSEAGCIAVIDHDLKLGITGIEIMGLAHNINPLIKTIICSGQQNVEIAIRYYELGCFYYIYKDVYDFDKIFIAKIREAIEKTEFLIKMIKAKGLFNRIIDEL